MRRRKMRLIHAHRRFGRYVNGPKRVRYLESRVTRSFFLVD